MKTIDNSEPLIAIGTDQPFSITWDTEKGAESAYPADLIRLVIQRLPTDGWTLVDSRHGARCLEAIMKPANGAVELEDADYDWLRRMVNDHAPKLLGINAVLLDDALSLADESRAERRWPAAAGASVR